MSEIYRDDTLVITHEQDGYYIESFKKGRSPESFVSLVNQIPNLEITRFQIVRNALVDAPYGPELFGIEKERITVKTSSDQLEAYVTLGVSPAKMEKANRKDLIMEVMDALRNVNVTYGILYDALKGDLPVNEPILIAQGISPIHGRDAVIKMYEIRDPKPTLIENGKVDYYDLNLINKVQAGDWLGERIDPVPGIPGRSVFGKDLYPSGGLSAPLHYERNSIELVREEGKDVLYALKSGAVSYKGDDISVYDVLEIKGDVDFNSGNIDFNGYVSIKGSVEENFTVRAGKDIEISGEYGLGGVNTIESVEGNIYIRGGIAGKNKAKIICKKNLYVKYLSDVDVVCEGSVYVGFYIRNSQVRAKQVIVDSPRGQIVGGTIDTEVKVECADIGNWMETRTQIIVRGFNRNVLQNKIEEITILVLEKKELLVKLKLLMKKPESGSKAAKDNSVIQKTRHALLQVQDEIKGLEAERLSLQSFMKTPGEGAVIVRKHIYPKVRLIIQDKLLEIGDQTMASVYIVKDDSVQSI